MANERKDDALRQQPAREARPREGEPPVQDTKPGEEPLDEQSLDRVMRDCPL
jgi:hypothetical protein